jgi:phage baseplate assembly protein V
MDIRERKKLYDKIRNSSALRVTLDLVDDKTKMQKVQASGLEGEIFPSAEKFESYGFTSHPPLGSEAVAFPIGGDRGHLAILAAGDRGVRKKDLAPGETAIYTLEGDHLHFKNGNKLEMLTKESSFDSTTKSEFKAPELLLKGALSAEGYEGEATTFSFKGDLTITGNLTVSGNITVSGDVSAGGDVTAGGISLKSHVHPGDSGGTTGSPKS